MRYANYNSIKELIRDRVSFRGNSVVAIKYSHKYEVYSYDTLILSISKDSTYFNTKYYSRTTSRLQNIIKEIM